MNRLVAAIDQIIPSQESKPREHHYLIVQTRSENP